MAISLPDEVVLDTSFVARALITTEAHHGACQAFLLRLVEDEVPIYFNRLLNVELAEVAFKIAVVQQHGSKAWPAKRYDGRVRRLAGRLQRQLLLSWTKVLETVPHAVVELHEVADEVPALMAAYGLGSYDAAHVATAEYVSAPLVATDAGFGRVPAARLTLYVDNSRVASARRHRRAG
ncbi:MAG: type II toxin-antitoxin system VapC family toxin [Mycobacteriales bacterium]